MKEYVNFSTFTDRFNAIRPDSFTYEGLRELFDYLEQLDEEMETEREFNVIELDCEYYEWNSLEAFEEEYDNDINPENYTYIPIPGTDRFITDSNI